MKSTILRNLLFVLIFSLLSVGSTFAEVPDVVLNQKKAVVTIYINDKNGEQVSTGSGFIMDSNGIIATNYHVLSDWLESSENTLFIKMENGAYFPIQKIIIFDKSNDIALFKIEGKELPTVKLATGYKPKQGEDIVVIGSPLGLETTVSSGIISSVRLKGEAIQITAPVSPGSSGSPVFNSKGEVIGVATFLIKSGQNLNFAIPVKHIQNLITESKKPTKKQVIPDEEVMVDKEPNPTQKLAPIDELEKAKAKVKEFPDLPEAHFFLGLAYSRLNKNKEAINAYEQAIRIKPDFSIAHSYLGGVYVRLEMYKNAAEEFKQAIRIEPDYADAYIRLGSTYLLLKMNKEAVDVFKQIIRKKPDYAEAHLGLGQSYSSMRMDKEAIETYKQAIRLKPDYAEAYYELGVNFTFSGSYQKAIEAYKQAIRIKPDYAEAYWMLGETYLRLNDRGSALEQYKILKTLDPEQANELFNSIYK